MSKPLCILQAPTFIRSGYGDWALDIAKSLLRYDKYELFLAPTIWGACSKRNIDPSIIDDETKVLLNRILQGPLTKQPDVFIQMSIPNEFIAPAKFNIGMTAGIETTVPRAEWIEGLNRMNVNFVLSNHAKDVFVNTNYTKTNPNGMVENVKLNGNPMEVLFWGANLNKYYKTNEKVDTIEKELSTIPEEFAFLFVGQWTAGNIRSDRKNIGYLIKTFLETFTNMDNPPCLILKTSGAQICIMDRYECINKINDVTNMVKNELPPGTRLPNVYLLHGELTDKEMNALFNHEKVKMHISFTHGEGYGHPLLLSTLSGKPLLAPKWSGHLDFLNPTHTPFLEGSLNQIPPEAVNDWFVKEAKWFDVDLESAKIKMKYYYQNYDFIALERAEKLRLENIEKFSIQAMDKLFHSYLDKYVPKFAIEESIKLPKLKKLNLPRITHNNDEIEIKQSEPSTIKTTSDTSITKIT